MKFFADTADIAEIRELAETGLLDGVTTNPRWSTSRAAISSRWCASSPTWCGPVSAEVVALDYDGMMREAEILRNIGPNIAIKVPLTPDGLKACKALTADGPMVNVTLCFSAAQALLAAKAGATFISPFVGRHDDIGIDGMSLIADIRLIYDNYDFATHPGRQCPSSDARLEAAKLAWTRRPRRRRLSATLEASADRRRNCQLPQDRVATGQSIG